MAILPFLNHISFKPASQETEQFPSTWPASEPSSSIAPIDSAETNSINNESTYSVVQSEDVDSSDMINSLSRRSQLGLFESASQRIVRDYGQYLDKGTDGLRSFPVRFAGGGDAGNDASYHFFAGKNSRPADISLTWRNMLAGLKQMEKTPGEYVVEIKDETGTAVGRMGIRNYNDPRGDHF